VGKRSDVAKPQYRSIIISHRVKNFPRETQTSTMSLSTRGPIFQREQAEKLCIVFYAILAAVIDQRDAT
jgi:hypothetical protein